jgi:hypothetical protein
VKTVKIEATIVVPVDATDEQIHEWVSYNIHERAQMSGDNPLCDYDIETEWRSLCVL